MGCLTRLFSVLVSIAIIFAGLWNTDRGMFGGNNPQFGIPVMIIGVCLFLFIAVISLLRTKRPTTLETFVITIGVILLVIGISNINVRVLSAWPILVCTVGVLVIIFHRKITGWVRWAAGFIKPRKSGK